jgi:hypothetical protein
MPDRDNQDWEMKRGIAALLASAGGIWSILALSLDPPVLLARLLFITASLMPDYN